MKKVRFLALILCMALMISVLPQGISLVKAKGEDNTVAYTASRAVLNGYATYNVTINVVIDRVAKKAKVSLSRTDFTIRDEDYVKEEYKDTYKALKSLRKNNYGFFTADVTEDKLEYEGGNVEFKLENFVWETAKFYITGFVGGKGYPGRFMTINKWKNVTVGGLGNGHVCLGENDWDGDEGFSFKRVTDYTPVEEPVKTDKEFTMGRDSFGFINSDSSFLSTASAVSRRIYGNTFNKGTYGYMLDASAYDSMMLGRSNSQKAEIISNLNGRFNGACYGMSITSGLIFEGKIGLNQVGKADKTASLKAPVKNRQLLRTLIFYQICTGYDLVNYESRNSKSKDSEDTALEIVDSLQKHPENPVVVAFSFRTDSSSKWNAHAVLAFKVEEKDQYYKYDVSVYDPNNPDSAEHLLISETGRCRLSGDYGDNIFLRTSDMAKDMYDITLKYPEAKSGQAVILADGDVKITVGKKTATISGGKISGKLDVTAESLYGSDETIIIVPVSKGQSIRVKRNSGTSVSVQTKNEFVLATDGTDDVTVKSDGSVTAKTNGKEGTLAVAADKTKGDLFGTTVKTKVGTIEITPTSKGAEIKTGKGDSDITVSGEKESVTFEGADASKGANVKTSQKKASLTNSDKTVVKGKATEKGTIVKVGGSSGNDTKENSNLKIKKDNDITGYTPTGWSWKAVSGTEKQYFVPGKYVREDGMAVIYIKDTKSTKEFTYVLYELPMGAKQSTYKTYDWESGSEYVKAVLSSKTSASDTMSGLSFTCKKDGSITVKSDWIDEMYYQYDGPDGTYYLVKQVK